MNESQNPHACPARWRDGPQCSRPRGHGGTHLYRCADPGCPGRPYPASEHPHPPDCGRHGPMPKPRHPYGLEQSSARARTPRVIRALLFETLAKLERGPAEPVRIAESQEQFEWRVRGRDEVMLWMRTWIEPELRKVLAWADGAHGASEIECYDQGGDYGKGD